MCFPFCKTGKKSLQWFFDLISERNKEGKEVREEDGMGRLEEEETSRPLGNHDKLTDQQTDLRTDRVIGKFQFQN